MWRVAIRLFLALAIAAPIVMSITPAATAAKRKCMGERPTLVGTKGADTLRGTRRADVIVGLGGNDEIYGKGGADRICAGGGSDSVYGGPKRDRIAGQAGNDLLVGGGGRDVLLGGGGVDLLLGMQGSDHYVGGRGVDIAAFLAAQESIFVDLSAEVAVGEGVDTLERIEAVVGSAHGDALYGDGGQNFLWGYTGDDYLDGGDGEDFVLFTLSEAGVRASLADARATGEGSDEIVSIENLFGSDHDDTLIGNAGPNFLIGAEGHDTTDGRGGHDLCFGEVRMNCPALPDDAPAQPPSGDDPPPPPSGTSRSSAIPRTASRAQGDGAFARLGREFVRTATALATTTPDPGYFDCIYNVAHPPVAAGEGWVAWKPWFLYYSAATGYYWIQGGWTLPHWQWTGTMLPQQAPKEWLFNGFVAAYYQVYDYYRSTYHDYYAPAAAKDGFGKIFYQGSIWCGA